MMHCCVHMMGKDQDYQLAGLATSGQEAVVTAYYVGTHHLDRMLEGLSARSVKPASAAIFSTSSVWQKGQGAAPSAGASSSTWLVLA
jgi:hypothetical protein